MTFKSISFFFLIGLVIYLSSCAKNDNMTPDPNPNPNPNDTITHDTTTHDTTTTDTTHIDTNSTSSNLVYPASFVFKNNVIPETEYYQITSSGKIKISEPYYMRYSKNLLNSSIKDDHSMPFKELRFTSNGLLTVVYKDSSVAENNLYTLQNNKDLFLKSTGYLGSFNADKTAFNVNLSPYTYSNDGNRPMYARLYLCVTYSPDKDKTIDYLVFSQSLATGDTLAINFAQMLYIKK